MNGAQILSGHTVFSKLLTNVLQCHDDELEGRRIAFIWYLVPEDWDVTVDGGCLELIECVTSGEHHLKKQALVSSLTEQPIPWKVSASLSPQRNMFVFFEVSALSFHQVAEILGDKARISLHGWFHGPPLPRPPANEPHSITPPLISPIHIEEELIYSWLNPVYLDMDEQAKIRRRFKRSSEIQLAHFLRAEKWMLLARMLATIPQSAWCLDGPINRKHYNILKSDITKRDEGGSDLVRQVQRLFSSEAMQVILTDLTGVKLHSDPDHEHSNNQSEVQPPQAKRANMEGSSVDIGDASQQQLSKPQLRCWRPGDYILLADTDIGSGSRWRLESVLHVAGYGSQEGKARHLKEHASADRWQSSWGGQLVYVAKDEQDELLTVHPKDNSLTLVYTGPGTASFVKYINHTAKPLAPRPPPDSSVVCAPADGQPVGAYDLSVVFYEPGGADEVDDGDDDEGGNDTADEDAEDVTDEDSGEVADDVDLTNVFQE